jgi:hypothetical protein
LIDDGGPITPEALHVTLNVTYVPPLGPYRPDTSPDNAGGICAASADQDADR